MHPELSKRLVLAQLQEALGTEGLFSEKVTFIQENFPRFYIQFVNVAGISRLIQFDCTNYDFQAIAIEPVEPGTYAPLPQDNWMKRSGGNFPSHQMKGGGQFLCLEGTRDFYTHEGHRPQITGERWDKWRGNLTIRDLLTVIKSKFASGEWS